MKNRYILWISICLVVLAGCSGETYKGDFPDDYADLGEPIPIILGLGVPSYDILTRGSGPFENTLDEETKTLWENAKFFVYAFKRDPEADLRTIWSEGNEDVCLLDGHRTLKEKGLGGKETRVNIENTSLMPFWPDEDELKVYYNTKHVDWAYNFFAYYVDDSPTTVHRERDHIYLDVEADGRRDFMSAMAEVTDEQIKKLEGTSSKDKIIQCAYSAYSANRGINPVFRFKHHLARFRFLIYSGESDKDKVPDIALTGIKLMARTKGKFIVAVNDPLSKELEKPILGLTFKEPELKPIALRERDNTELKSYRVKLPAEGDDPNQKIAVPVGGSLLLPVESSYLMKVTLVGDGETADAPLEYSLYPPSPSEKFEAGKLYTVRIAIYSLSSISVGIEAGEWGEGGEANLSPDDKWEE